MNEDLGQPGGVEYHVQENVVALEPPAHGLERADLEGRQNKVFAQQFFPVALEHIGLLQHDGHKEMGFQQAHPGAERVIKPIPPRFDPEHDGDNGQVEQEDQVGHVAE